MRCGGSGGIAAHLGGELVSFGALMLIVGLSGLQNHPRNEL